MDVPERIGARNPIRLLVTVDTEPDNVWQNFRSRGMRNIVRLPRFHKLMCSLGIRPTYLVTYSVASDPASVGVLRRIQDQGPCEIGAHLHAWETPPFLPGEQDRAYPVFAHELPVDAFRAKMETLTELIAANFGVPTAYRAGRFGFSAEHIPVLEALGYIVDSSVTPLINRSRKRGLPLELGGRGGRDYRRAPLDYYHPDYADDLRPGGAHLLELPVTVGPIRPVSEWMMLAHRYGPELLQRLVRKVGLSQVVLASVPEVTWELIRGMLDTAFTLGRSVLTLIVHSSECMVGGAPWITSEAQTRDLADRLRRIADWAAEHGPAKYQTMTELAREIKALPAGVPVSAEVRACL